MDLARKSQNVGLTLALAGENGQRLMNALSPVVEDLLHRIV